MNKIAEAKALLEQNGYLVIRRYQLGERMSPRDFCELIRIDRHTLTRHLKDQDCPNVKQKRGPKGRLLWLQPTQELVRFLRRNKRSS